MLNENETIPRSGWIPLFTFLLGLPISVVLFVILVNLAENGAIALPIAALLFALVIVAAIGFLTGLCGLMAVQPNQARALLLFGDYKGTVRTSGFFWVNPFYTKTKVSLRIRNFETGSTSQEEKKDTAGQIVQHKSRTHGRPSKVNDRDGNPIEISAVVVWKVVNTAEALFEVDDYENFVAVQSEAALRAMATRHPYDSEDHEVSLRGSADEISRQLTVDIQERLDKAGVEVIESRISHLAYAQEIAAAMLQRQQASAVVAARTQIVDGAVGMVEMALAKLAERQVVELDEERRATMVSNLLVVLCSDRHTQPVINTGTLY
jgi:regulator of protease activity HflC (stomatin/prohibitin superfamily)